MKSLLHIAIFSVLSFSFPLAANAQDLIAKKRVDSVFFGLVKPGIGKPRSVNDYI